MDSNSYTPTSSLISESACVSFTLCDCAALPIALTPLSLTQPPPPPLHLPTLQGKSLTATVMGKFTPEQKVSVSPSTVTPRVEVWTESGTTGEVIIGDSKKAVSSDANDMTIWIIVAVLCVCVCVCACVRVCVRVCVRARVRVCVYNYVHHRGGAVRACCLLSRVSLIITPRAACSASQ